MTTPPRCHQCANFTRPNRCAVYGLTRPMLDCSPCPNYRPRQTKPKPESAPSTGLCAACVFDPGQRDLFCRRGNQHASATRCKGFAVLRHLNEVAH